jgi:hypothetical protein
MMATLIDLTRSTFYSLKCKPGWEWPTQSLWRHQLWLQTMNNCLISQQHWSPIVICYSGILLGFCTNPIVNAMPNKQPPMSSALHTLPRGSKTLLLQQTMIGRNNMVEIERLSRTFSFALMTSSVVWRAPNAHGYSIGLRYLMFGPFWVVQIWHARRHFYYKMLVSSSKIDHPCCFILCLHCPTYLNHLSLITMDHPILTVLLQLRTTSPFW